MPIANIIFEHLIDKAQYKTLPSRPGVELYRAHLLKQAFAPHCHDGFSLGAIASGVERFRYQGCDHIATPKSLITLNPAELHTGQSEGDQGWSYQMIYVDEKLAQEMLGVKQFWFDAPTQTDGLAARRVTALLSQLWRCTEPLQFDGELHALLQEFAPHAVRLGLQADQPGCRDPRWLRVFDYIDSMLAEVVLLDDLAGVAGLSRFHFLRSFKQHMRYTPHQYLMARRLNRAKSLLASGLAIADVAAHVGMTDQAHLTRRFAGMFGVTPAAYQQQLGTRPRRRH